MAKDIGLVEINQRSGYCRSNFTFYSKRNPEPLPSNTVLDVTTFISSHANHRNKIAFIDASTGHHISFSEVWEAIDSVASSLYDMGIRKGDVVLILSPNSIFFPIVTNSVMSLGAVITTSNPLNTKHEINKQIVDLKPVLAFTTSELLPKLADSNLHIILIGTSSEYTDFKSKKLKIVHFLDEIMNRKQQSLIQVKERVTQDDTASLLYSSGTTGVSKGVITTHRNFIAMISTALKQFKRDEREQIYICILPMFHIYGLGAFCMTLLASGSTVVILSKKFEIQQMLSAIEKYKVSYLPLVPPVLVEMVNNADRMKEEYDLRSLEWVVCGGAPLSKEVTEMFLQKYPGVVVLQGYGMTETTGMGASTVLAEESLKYGTAGMLAVYMEAMVVEPGSGKAVAENRLGELWLKGPTVMKGYFNNPEATASTLDLDGWLRTGDLCYIDEDGFVFVVDRLKELIKYKGYQVLPAELEALLLTHPEIDDCAVIPFPDKDVGQFPMAYIVRKTGSNLSDNAVMDFISKQVAPYKRIRQVTFIGSIPKNPSGKKLRKNLIRLATSKL